MKKLTKKSFSKILDKVRKKTDIKIYKVKIAKLLRRRVYSKINKLKPSILRTIIDYLVDYVELRITLYFSYGDYIVTLFILHLLTLFFNLSQKHQRPNYIHSGNHKFKDRCCHRALLFAAKHGHRVVLQYIYKWKMIFNINMNFTNTWGETPFLNAARYGHLSCLEYLATLPYISFRHMNENGYTALILAAENGHLECVKFLSQKKFRNSMAEFSVAFSLAAHHGYSECLRFFTQLTHTNIKQIYNPSLLTAAQFGHFKCIEFLSTLPTIELTYSDIYGFSALLMTAKNGHLDCLQLLSTLPNININQATYTGETTLSIIAKKVALTPSDWNDERTTSHKHLHCCAFLLSLPDIDINPIIRGKPLISELISEKYYNQELIGLFLDSIMKL